MRRPCHPHPMRRPSQRSRLLATLLGVGLLAATVPGLCAIPALAQDPPRRPAESLLESRWPRLDRIDHLTVEDGLSHGTIWALVQDPRGFLWIGTPEGLDRYDGYRFVRYEHDDGDPHSLVTSAVTDLAVDAEGRLWIGTGSGLDRWDRATDRFVHYPHRDDDPGTPSSDHILDLTLGPEGRLWVGTLGGLDRYDPATDTFARVWPAPGASPAESLDGAGDDTPPETEEATVEATVEVTAEVTAEVSVPTWVSAIETTRSGALLFATPGRVLRWHPEEGTVEPLELGGALATAIWDIEEDRQGRLWLALADQGVLRWDPESGELRHFRRDPDDPTSLADDRVRRVLEDRRGHLWLATQLGGLALFDGEGFRAYVRQPGQPSGLGDTSISTLYEDHQGVLWIGGYVGLDRYDPSREQFRLLRERPGEAGGLASDSIWAIHQDIRGDLWLGTYSDGLMVLDDQGRVKRHWAPEAGRSGSLQDGVVSAIVEDASGTVWVATWGGLHRFDRENERFEVYRHDPDDPDSLSHNTIYHMIVDSGDDPRGGALWLATTGGGLEYFDIASERFVHHLADEGRADSLCSDSVRMLHQGGDGTLWAGTDSGLARHAVGAGDRFTCYRHDPDGPASLASNLVEALWSDAGADADGWLWVGTRGGGFGRLDPATGHFERLGDRDLQGFDTVMAIEGDRLGRLWLSTEEGLARFDPATETFQHFGVDDGLPAAQFTYVSSHRNTQGELFFGTSDGLLFFDPDEIVDDPQPPPVEITEFMLFNRPAALRRDDSDSPLEQTIGTTDTLVLTHRDYVFGFEFAALHLASPRHNRYAYRLEGFDRDWIETDATRRFAQYSNIAPGTYTFRVRAANPDGVWNEEGAALALTILPAPWRTPWAYALYVALALGLVALWVRAQRREVARERAASRRLREINRLKDQFLANTSHELRTPLYGIVGLAESLADGGAGELGPAARRDLATIVSSGKRLSSLVGDILDYSRLTDRRLQLRRGPVDLRALTDIVLTLAAPLVGSKALDLVNAVDSDLPTVDADEARLQQILLNLVGNAVKFTEAGRVEVSALLEGGRVEVRVRDTGIGIPADKQASIFEAFEQADASTEREFGGTGLGLAVTKQLVTLHGGTVGVDSTPGEGSLFYFTLPQSALGEESGLLPETVFRPPAVVEEVESVTVEPAAETAIELPEGQLRILIVDDEPVNRQVLVRHLQARGYGVMEASSGREALRRVAELGVPDLVLLDVMMPKMSGYEVCRRLRRDYPAHELPIIFLTAKNQPHDLVSGFEIGANDYLTKPIPKSELLARVQSHLELLYVHRNLEQLVEERTAQVKVLGGLLPICGECKSIRDDQGYWQQLETFVHERSEATFTHGICPDCAEKLYGELLRPMSADRSGSF